MSSCCNGGGCGGCGTGGCCQGGGCAPVQKTNLNRIESALLRRLASVLYLPMAQFVLVPRGCTPEEGTLILSPVLLENPDDDLEDVVRRGDALVSLARKGLVTLDFDLPLQNYSYGPYYQSDLFREFSSGFADHPQGRPTLRRGSVAITSAGLEQ